MSQKQVAEDLIEALELLLERHNDLIKRLKAQLPADGTISWLRRVRILLKKYPIKRRMVGQFYGL